MWEEGVVFNITCLSRAFSSVPGKGHQFYLQFLVAYKTREHCKAFIYIGQSFCIRTYSAELHWCAMFSRYKLVSGLLELGKECDESENTAALEWRVHGIF